MMIVYLRFALYFANNSSCKRFFQFVSEFAFGMVGMQSRVLVLCFMSPVKRFDRNFQLLRSTTVLRFKITCLGVVYETLFGFSKKHQGHAY